MWGIIKREFRKYLRINGFSGFLRGKREINKGGIYYL